MPGCTIGPGLVSTILFFDYRIRYDVAEYFRAFDYRIRYDVAEYFRALFHGP